METKLRLSLMALSALALSSTAAFAEPMPYGAWARGDGVVNVVIKPCGDSLCAINTWIKPGVTSEKVGDKLVLNIKRQESARWEGTAFDPQRDISFKISVVVQPETMKTLGCMLGGLLCKSVDWTRIAGN